MKCQVLVILYCFTSLQEQIATPKTHSYQTFSHLYWRVINPRKNDGSRLYRICTMYYQHSSEDVLGNSLRKSCLSPAEIMLKKLQLPIISE